MVGRRRPWIASQGVNTKAANSEMAMATEPSTGIGSM